MTNTICKDNFICDALINEDIHVVVLDDEGDIRYTINDVIKKELGWKVIIIENREDAVKLCQDKKAIFYILDVHLGPKRPQEGFDTANEIKVIDPNLFVCIFSGVPNAEKYRKMAGNIRVDYFQKKGNVVREDVLKIVLQMLLFQWSFLNCIIEDCFSPNTEINNEIKVQTAKIFSKIQEVSGKIQQVTNKLEDIQKLNKTYDSENTGHLISDKLELDPKLLPIEEDKNIQKYESYKREDPEWRKKYQDKYVAFADGKWLEDFVADNSKDLLDKLRKSEHKGRSIFYKKVPKNNKEKVYESSMSLHNFFL
jgi:response regulator RpfG family c-di-GMP phosphodiesterase